MQTQPDVEWLPHTKLEPPYLGTDLFVRPRLLGRLDQAAQQRRLVLLSAPSGYGKTTLLGQWMQQVASRTTGAAPLRVAWLSLDGSENDPTHFLLALIAALQTLHPACGRRAKAFVTAGGQPVPVSLDTLVQLLSGLLIIDIVQYVPERFVLALDAYEQIHEPAVHEALKYLLRRLPAQACVIVSSSVEPPLSLARLRAAGMSAEIRTHDLAFDEEESALFLEDTLGRKLGEKQRAALLRYTGGWPAMLQLAARELAQRPGTQTQANWFSRLGDVWMSPVPLPGISAYFDEVLLASLPRSLRHFLRQTSILSALSEEACRAVTGRADAGDLLAEAARRNLCVAGTTGAYQYHPLLAAHLRRLLGREQPDQLRRLHCRAAEVETAPPVRIRHLLAAGEWAQAALAIAGERERGELSHEDEDALARVVSSLPEDVLQAQPSLRMVALHSNGGPRVTAAALAVGLTPRQVEVLALLMQGAGNREIADQLVITLPTAKEHVGQIYRKLGVGGRRAAVERAAELGLLPSAHHGDGPHRLRQ